MGMGGMVVMISFRQADLVRTLTGRTEVWIYVRANIKPSRFDPPVGARRSGNQELQNKAEFAVMIKPTNDRYGWRMKSIILENWRGVFTSGHGGSGGIWEFELDTHSAMDENTLKTVLMASITQINEEFDTNCDYKYHEIRDATPHIKAVIKFDFHTLGYEQRHK